MADINLKQVVHNVKEALVTRGVTDVITYGNIDDIVLELGGETKKINNIEAIDANIVRITYDDSTTTDIAVEYDSDGKITKLNGITAIYDGDILVKLGSVNIDIEEIPSKSGGLIPGGYTVTFISEDNPYTIVSVTDGQSVFAPSPNPTSESGSFVGWSDGAQLINFPYPVTQNITMNAEFQSTRTEMEWLTSGDWFTDRYYDTPAVRKKTNNELTIMATATPKNYTMKYYVMLGRTETAIAGVNFTKGTIDYDGVTWFYNIFYNERGHNITDVIDKSIPLQVSSDAHLNYEKIANSVLDYYFMKG